VLAAALIAAVAAFPAQGAYGLRPVASGFNSPTYVATAPGAANTLYVVEQGGRIVKFANGRRSVFLDIRSRVLAGGERGLFSVAFHPKYTSNHRFYVDYTDTSGNTRVVEFRSRGGVGRKSTARQLLYVRQPYANHNGGQLQFGPNSLLYVGMGDGGSGGDPQNHAQDPSSKLGKLLRMNPLKRPIYWSQAGLGLRNPWRFSFDRANGDLWIADVGQNEWEEVDYRPRSQLPRRANYGWSVYEGRERYSPNRQLRTNAPLVQPIYAYNHDGGECSITGGYVYRGSSVPAAQGRYFFGDYCSGRVWSLRLVNGAATDVRREGFSVSNLSSFGEGGDGELYAVSQNGTIYKLVP
jgi:glucose/arabinose dehydrogenase